jgi:hypothetical protein
MDNEYECMRCKYITPRKINMKKHLDKSIKCVKTLDSIGFTDEQLYETSLVKIGKRNKGCPKCEYCEKEYSSVYTLKRHVKYFCKNKKEDEKPSIKNIEESNIQITNNITNNQINNNQTNNNIINIINLPVGFEKEWNTDHMNNYLKQLIVVSDNKYTSLLTKILDNKQNLNVICDKEIEDGYVFRNNEYENVEKKEIVDKSMEKLNKELNRMLQDVIENSELFTDKSAETHKNIINDKYNEYTTNTGIQKIVQKYIIDIYDATKNVANDYLIEHRKVNKEGF